MKRYSNVIFDLFDTLILFQPSLLPKIKFNGKEHFSTGKDVFKTFRKYFENYNFDEFYGHFTNSYKKFQELKDHNNREYPNGKRFEIMLADMGIGDYNPLILQEFTGSHMESLSNSMIFPEEYRATIDGLIKRDYRLSILSNFDCSVTALKLLELNNIKHYFDQIFISENIGWRKPSPKAFEYAINKLNISVCETVYVGNDYERDIIGAQNANIDSIFINPHNQKISCSPAIASLSEFVQILDILP